MDSIFLSVRCLFNDAKFKETLPLCDLETLEQMTHSHQNHFDINDALIPILIGSIVLGLGAITSLVFNSSIPLVISGVVVASGVIVKALITTKRYYTPATGFNYRRVKGSMESQMHLGHPSNANDYRLCKKKAVAGKKRLRLKLPYFSR